MDGLQLLSQLGAVEIASMPPPAVSDHALGSATTTIHRNVVIKHILAPLDGSALAAEALGYVAAVAKAWNARVTLLRVLEGGGSHQPVDALDWELARGEAQGYMARIQSDLSGSDISAEVHIVDGRASEQVLHFAATAGVDLIVLASHGAGGNGQWRLSGTVHKVIASTSSSVLLVPARGRKEPSFDLRFRKILVGLDCSQRSECVVPTALALAQAHGAELLLAHAVPEPELPRRVAPAAREVDLARQVTEANHREAQRYLRELQARISRDCQAVHVHTVVSSHAAKALRQLATEAQVDLIMIAAHGATGDADEAYGGVAAALVADPCHPIIIVQDMCRGSTRSTDNDGRSGDAGLAHRS